MKVNQPLLNESFTQDFEMDRTSIVQKEEEEIKSENVYLVYFLVSVVFFAINAFQVKLLRIHFAEKFSNQLFVFSRSVGIMTIAYIKANHESIEIIKFSEVKQKNWFIIRTYGNYISFIAMVIALNYIKVSTYQCLFATNPLFILFAGYYFLGERLTGRFFIGIAICFVGAYLILSGEKGAIKNDGINDKNSQDNNSQSEDNNQGYIIFIGVVLSLINITVYALTATASKILFREKIEPIPQIYWTGFSNAQCAFVFYILGLIFGTEIKFSLYFFLLSATNGLVFYIGYIYLLDSFKHLEMGKTTAISYIQVIIIFLLGAIFLGESIYFTDILGSLVILGYNLYNSYYPV